MREDGRVWHGGRWQTPEQIERKKAVNRGYAKTTRAANVEAARARDRAKYRANPERAKGYTRAWVKNNQERNRQTQKDRYDSSPGKIRDSWRKYCYGVTSEDMGKAEVLQKGSCAACFNPFTETPSIDHCHTTGAARGLLCRRCNLDLEVFERHQVYPPAFQEYLRSPPFRQLGIHAVGSKFKNSLGEATP